jgi:hypothetical protein
MNTALPGLFSSYKRTRTANPDLLVKPAVDASICNVTYSDKVIITNGKKIKECILATNKAAIYIWRPKCKGKYCYSLDAIQAKCNANNIELFIVAEYYDHKEMEKEYVLKRPLFGIDTKYYRTNLTPKYLKKFKFDVASQKDIEDNFLLFKDGLFVKSFNEIKTLDMIF